MPAGPSDADADELLELAVRMATRAADLLIAGLDQTRAEVATKSSLTDMVTEIDQASEALIVAELRSARPDDEVVAEEGSRHPGTSGLRWVIDPLDGTTNYLRGHPGFSVSIALEDVEGALVGAVVDPMHGDTFTAVRGAGAARNGRAIRCSERTELSSAVVATGFSYEPERRRRQAGVLTGVLPAVADIRRMGAAAVDLCWVACGRVDAFYERGLHRWDWSAGALVAREAGAVTTDLSGGAPSDEFVLAAPPALIASLTTLLQDNGADQA